VLERLTFVCLSLLLLRRAVLLLSRRLARGWHRQARRGSRFFKSLNGLGVYGMYLCFQAAINQNQPNPRRVHLRRKRSQLLMNACTFADC
jgi:hypothetical protein